MPEPATAPIPETQTPAPSEAWLRVQELVCELSVDLPVPNLKVRDLIQLRPQAVIDSQWQVSADVPLRVNGELIAWSEFEVVGERLAVRLTELA